MRSTTYASRTSTASTTTRAGSLGFDWLIAILSTIFVGGLYLDGWAHIHVPELETFFTPWHGVLYAGFLAVAAAIVGVVVLNHRRGASWWSAIPAGYGLSLLGISLFAVGGVLDMTWHQVLGIETDVEALLSPPHLVLATGFALIISGPLRAAWRRTGIPSLWRTHMPMLLSIALLLALLAFFTQYAHPFASTLAAQQFQPDPASLGGDERAVRRFEQLYHALGIASVLLQTGVLMGLLLPIIRRWTLPLGSLTLIFTTNSVLLALMRDRTLATGPLPIIGAALVAGIAADILCRVLRPAGEATQNLRITAFAIPAILYALYFGTLQLFGGIWWTLPFWTGAVVLAGVVGLLLSFVLLPTSASEGPKFR
jgi:hypothetical protein